MVEERSFYSWTLRSASTRAKPQGQNLNLSCSRIHHQDSTYGHCYSSSPTTVIHRHVLHSLLPLTLVRWLHDESAQPLQEAKRETMFAFRWKTSSIDIRTQLKSLEHRLEMSRVVVNRRGSMLVHRNRHLFPTGSIDRSSVHIINGINDCSRSKPSTSPLFHRAVEYIHLVSF